MGSEVQKLLEVNLASSTLGHSQVNDHQSAQNDCACSKLACQTHLAGVNSVVILVGVSAAALGFVRHSFLTMVHAVLTSNPE